MIPLDLKRLVDHEVELFGLDLEAVWKVIQAFIRHCDAFSSDRGDLQVESDEERQKFRISSPYVFPMAREHPEHSVELALTSLLRRPRILKHALRRTWLAWQELHGEVNLDDMMVYDTVHTVSSTAIAFIRDNWGILTSEAQSDRNERRKKVEQAWENQVARMNADEQQWLTTLLGYMFPLLRDFPSGMPRAQGITKERYWSRIANGWIEPGGVLDQKILKDVKAWKDSGDASAIVERLTTDVGYTGVFEQLFEYGRPARLSVTGDDVLRLASLLFEQMRVKFGAKADSDSCPGFIPLWRLQSRGRRFKDYAAWLWAEMEKTMQVSINLRNDLEYYWGSRKYSPLEEDARRKLRQQTAEWAQEHLDSTGLCAVLEGAPNWALLHFVAGAPHDAKNAEPVWDEWRWLSQPLLMCIEVRPVVMIPQACCIFLDAGQRFRDHMEEDGVHESRTETVYTIKRDWMWQFFGDAINCGKFIDLILAGGPFEEQWSAETATLVQQVREQTTVWRREGLKPPQIGGGSKDSQSDDGEA